MNESSDADQAAATEADLPELYFDRPHPARMYDYYLGGKTNYQVDRVAADQVLAVFPQLRVISEQNRAFLHRAVRFLTDAGVDQFLDIGTGIPTPPNLHEVAQQAVPATRVVYVDNDPIVLVHARALLESSPQGRTAYLEADLRSPEAILASPVLARTLDLSRPVALSLIAILHFVPDTDGPAAIVRTLLDALPAGSYIVMAHGTADVASEEAQRAVDIYRKRGIPFQTRSRAEIEALLPAGMELVEPGIQLLHRWRPETDPDELDDATVGSYGLIAYKR
jgi:hypothetical protein